MAARLLMRRAVPALRQVRCYADAPGGAPQMSFTFASPTQVKLAHVGYETGSLLVEALAFIKITIEIVEHCTVKEWHQLTAVLRLLRSLMCLLPVVLVELKT